MQCVGDLESHIEGMTRFWGGAPSDPKPPTPPVEPRPSDRGQSEGDAVTRLGPPSVGANDAPPSGSAGDAEGSGAAPRADTLLDGAISTEALPAPIRVEAFADIDALDLCEKLKRFT